MIDTTCDDCRRLTSGHCWRHPFQGSAPITEAVYVYHAHRWVFDTILPSGMLVYHCDEHDPPLVRQVTP